MDNTLRHGRFTSSQNHRAAASLASGKPSKTFFTYVEEKASERFMQRTADTKVTVRPMLWGKLMEVVLFNLLGLEYEMVHKETLVHPKYDFWSGTPDLKTPVKVGEIKCYEPKKFGALSRCLLRKDIGLLRSSFKEEYWQVVSNAIILGLDVAEVMVYMPYKSELLEIIKQVDETNFLERNGLNPQDYFYWLNEEGIESLPYLPDDSKASNINMFEFEVPKEDVDFLTERIILANDKVNELLKLGNHGE
jgi:hypothetical protein